MRVLSRINQLDYPKTVFCDWLLLAEAVWKHLRNRNMTRGYHSPCARGTFAAARSLLNGHRWSPPQKSGCVRVDRLDESPSPAFKIKIRHTSVHDNPDAQTQRSRCRLNQLCERLAARSTVPSNFSLSAFAEKYRARADSLAAIQDQAKRDFARSPLTELNRTGQAHCSWKFTGAYHPA